MDGHHSEAGARAQLCRLLALARDNEEKLQRFNEQELQLIATTSLHEVLVRVVLDLPAAFALEHVSLVLADRQELPQLLEACDLPPRIARHILLLDATRLEALGLVRRTPLLERFGPRYASLFPSHPQPVSVALLPLWRGSECIGSLNFGSADAQRYAPDSRTDFLERLAAVVAICIENGANHERVRHLSITDPLTGASNRRDLDRRLDEAVACAARSASPLACVFFDVDHFKRFNDTYGHTAGDAVLREVARRMRAELRRSDVLCRYGGEEFVALLPGTNGERALEIAERIRVAIGNVPFVLEDGRAVSITLSAGVAVQIPGGNDEAAAARLLHGADQAAYAAKAAGRNRVVGD